MSGILKSVLFAVCGSAVAFSIVWIRMAEQCVNRRVGLSVFAVAVGAVAGLLVMVREFRNGLQDVLALLSSFLMALGTYIIGIFIADAYGIWIMMFWPAVIVASAVAGFRLAGKLKRNF